MRTDSPHSPSRSIPLAVIVGLVVALFGSPLIGLLHISDRLGTTTAGTLLLNSLTMWILVATILVVVMYWEGRSVASIGIDMPSRREAIFGVVMGVVALALGILATGIAVVAFQLDQPETLSTVAELSLPVKLAVVGTAVITEEVLWRGYPIERLTELTGSIWIGAATSGVVFLAIHYPAWGLVGAIPQALFTLVIVGVYVETRNVVSCILTHTLINVTMILVLPTFL